MCAKGCEECESFTACTKYADGIIMIENEIITCSIGCETCDSGNPLICNRCSKSFYLDTDNRCKKCSKDCLKCSSFGVCESCVPNTQKKFDGSCAKC